MPALLKRVTSRIIDAGVRERNCCMHSTSDKVISGIFSGGPRLLYRLEAKLALIALIFERAKGSDARERVIYGLEVSHR
jgi:hypothetical protein